MNSKVMWLLVIVALGVGAYGGYLYEKTKFVKLMEAQRFDMQRQIDDAKLSTNSMMAKDVVVAVASNEKLGTYATAENGMALYTFDKDSKVASNCTGDCAKKWPPYVVTGVVPAQLPEHVGTIKRADGSTQYTWDGKPLYYYADDKDKEDVYGDGVGGVWHIAK